jgi:hypothetical protein
MVLGRLGDGEMAVFDPTAGMVRAVGSFLHGKPIAETPPPVLPKSAARRFSWLRRRPSPSVADPRQELEDDAEAAARWMAGCYPRRRYPAVAVGTANGALVHLCALLGIPWLPQNFSLPGRTPGAPWRSVERHGLGPAWREFLDRCLPDGSAILVVDAVGGEESGLVEELRARARHRNHAMVGLKVEQPGDLSPLVGDLYAWAYRRRGILSRRLLATSVAVGDPLWTFRLGAVPFWLYDLAEPAALGLERYLEAHPPFDYISLCLFRPEGASLDLAPVERWQAFLARAKRRGEGVGVEAASYPAGLTGFTRFQAKLHRIEAQFPPPPPLPLAEFGGFLRYAGRYRAAVRPVEGVVGWLS